MTCFYFSIPLPSKLLFGNLPPFSPSLHKGGGIDYVREASPLFDSPTCFSNGDFLKRLDKLEIKCYYSNSVALFTKEGEMTPVMRVDDEVMDKLKERAIDLGLVFSTPNEVLRAVFSIDRRDDTSVPDFVDLEIRNPHAKHRYHFIPVSKKNRPFFPGYKLPFSLETEIGVVKTYVTSAPKGTPIGDPDRGAYIQSGLREWFDLYEVQLVNGATLRIEALEPGKRYKLTIR
jgi:hypothetical protein